MLEFFRRYQRAFFVVITIVIVISFSFFGTYQTFQSVQVEDKVAFTAVDGSKVLSSELNDMITFLSYDSFDTLYASHAFAGNALNDGVIATDILETGLGTVLARDYLPEINDEIAPKLERERRYKSYKHPKVPFLSAEAIWSYYAPAIKQNLTKLQMESDSKSDDAFKTRIDLFLSERRFPSFYLKQFLRHQESQHKWLPQDPSLAHQDLALFGYHNTQDWFGRRFVELAAEFVINAAKMAERRGYSVTKEETLGSLFRNAENSFKQSRAQEAFGIANSAEYFQQFGRSLGMDQTRLVKVWSQVLLFRRLFFENADSILVDPSSYQEFYHTMNEFVDVDLYELPKTLQLDTLQDLEKFLFYVSAISKGQQDVNQYAFTLPSQFLTADDVKKEYPELVEKSYTVRWAMVNKEQLETKIGVKATWQWQVNDTNWQTLQARYPELAQTKATSADERLALLDKMDQAQRSVCDSFSRQQIVNAHPEWLLEALDEADLQEKVVTLRMKGGKVPFEGIQNSRELIERFNETPDFEPVISLYSQDGIHFYRFEVLDKLKSEQLLTFEQVRDDPTLDALVKERKTTSSFEKILAKLDKQVEEVKSVNPSFADWTDVDHSRIAVYFLPYLQRAREEIKQNPESEVLWVAQNEGVNSTLSESYKLVKSRERLVKRDTTFAVDPTLAFSQNVNSMTEVVAVEKRSPSFYTIAAKGHLPQADLIREKVLAERELLGHDAICVLGSQLAADMKGKKADFIAAHPLQTAASSGN